MAVKAFAMPKDVIRSSGDDTRIDINVWVVILGSDLGEFSSPNYELPITGVNPLSATVIDTAIAAGVQADLELHEVEFGPLDVVVVR